MKRISLLLICILGFSFARAQTKFLFKGKIEYERKINVHRQFDDEEESWFKEYVIKMPKFHTTYFDLYFSNNKTVYLPGREATNGQIWGIGPAKENIIITDFSKQISTSQKAVFENTYLLQDSIGKLQWKLADETRTILGFECRKAIAKICDSVYVVAFYTEEITVSGGPESFSGLPGMILEIAIPRLYTIWVATKVVLVEPTTAQLNPSTKGRKIDENDLKEKLKTSMSDWGKQGQRYIWWTML